MRDTTLSEPLADSRPSGGHHPGSPWRRRAMIKHLGLSVLSMSGVIGFCHGLHQDPQLAAALSPLLRQLPPGAPQPTAPLGEDLSGSSPLPSLFDPSNYREFLATIPLRHITIHQVVRSHFKKRGEVDNTLPPRDLWPQITPALLLADELGHRLDVPLLEVTSAYRSPEYNAQIEGAAESSQHLRNQALDLKFDCPVSRVAEVAHQMREEGFFQGGIGVYPAFLHVDTRGKNADWGRS